MASLCIYMHPHVLLQSACLWNLAPALEDGPVSWRSDLVGVSPVELYICCIDVSLQVRRTSQLLCVLLLDSLQTMVMGYGDFVPSTHFERALGLCMMLYGGSVYGMCTAALCSVSCWRLLCAAPHHSPFSNTYLPAYVIGDLCGMVSNRDPATAEYEQHVVRVGVSAVHH